jgi:hypothetical protein
MFHAGDLISVSYCTNPCVQHDFPVSDLPYSFQYCCITSKKCSNRLKSSAVTFNTVSIILTFSSTYNYVNPSLGHVLRIRCESKSASSYRLTHEAFSLSRSPPSPAQHLLLRTHLFVESSLRLFQLSQFKLHPIFPLISIQLLPLTDQACQHLLIP